MESDMKNILVVYATAGIGHKKASLAIKKALDDMSPEDVEVSLIDALDYTNAFFKWSYLKSYLLMVNRLPLLWGLSYYITDNFYVNLLVSIFRRINNWMNSRPLERYLLQRRPDVIVSTHFFASEVVSNLKARGLLRSHLVTVVTDYKLQIISSPLHNSLPLPFSPHPLPVLNLPNSLVAVYTSLLQSSAPSATILPWLF